MHSFARLLFQVCGERVQLIWVDGFGAVEALHSDCTGRSHYLQFGEEGRLVDPAAPGTRACHWVRVVTRATRVRVCVCVCVRACVRAFAYPFAGLSFIS